jgi:Ca-activated chloride channel family protein
MIPTVRLLLCIGALAGVLVRAAPRAPQQAPTFSAGVDGVGLHVVVKDGTRLVRGLDASSFAVTDNGVPQQISAVSTTERLAVAFVVDHSESVGIGPLDEMRAAALTMLDALSDDDMAGILTFTDRLNRRIAPSRHKMPLRTVLTQTASEPRTGTALRDAILAGASMVARQPGRPVVVVLSDGCDNASWTSHARATEWLGRSDVTVDLLSFGIVRRNREPSLTFSGGDTCYGRLDWDKTAEATGGRMFQTDRRDLSRALTDRVAERRSAYYVTYTPVGVTTNDGWHKVEVRLRGGARGGVTSRPGYFASRRAK